MLTFPFIAFHPIKIFLTCTYILVLFYFCFFFFGQKALFVQWIMDHFSVGLSLYSLMLNLTLCFKLILQIINYYPNETKLAHGCDVV